MKSILRVNGAAGLAVGLGLFLFGLVVQADDWPQWRGPNRDGKSVETGLLRAWPPGGPPLVWKAKGLGAGIVTVSVSKGRVFTAGDKGTENFVMAYSEGEGQPLWSAKLGKAGAPGWGGFAGPRCTPTVDGDKLYSIGQYGELVCLAVDTGKELWRKSLTSDFGGTVPEWGYSESPLVDGTMLLCTPGGGNGAIVALNKTNGEVIWRSKNFTDGAQYSSLMPAKIGGASQCIQLTMQSVAGVAIDDGRLLWRAARKGSVAVIPTPVIEGDQVYVTSGYKAGCNLFKISSEGGEFKATQTYAAKTIVNHHGGAVLVEGHIYAHCDDKGWTCQELKSGNVAWVEKEKMGKGSVLYADGHLYLREENKERSNVALIEATPAGYKEKSRFEQPDHSGKEAWPHPVIANGKLYLRDQDILLCYDVKQK